MVLYVVAVFNAIVLYVVVVNAMTLCVVCCVLCVVCCVLCVVAVD